MAFKDMIAADNAAVMLNTAEFAEMHVIKFDGNTYEIPAVLEKIRESDMAVPQSNRTQGVYKLSAKVYFNAKDVNENVPEQGKTFEIDDGEALGKPFFVKYRVATSENALGMVCVELEAYDE